MNIVAASCVFPSGPGMGLAGAALAARMGLVRRHPFHLDRSGTAARVSLFPQPTVFDVGRWVALARAALDDLHRQLPDPLPYELQRAQYTLWLVAPLAGRAGVPVDLRAQLAQEVVKGLDAEHFRFQSIHWVTGGHAAGIHAAQTASKALSDRFQCAIVLAVDSWLHPDALYWLEGEELLHDAGRMYQGAVRRNPYGRIPGEAAAAVMLHAELPGWCRSLGAGLAEEPILRTDPRPCTGVGWTQAAQQALAGLPEAQKVTHVFNDLNGEPYRADQFGFAGLRIANRLMDGWETVTPALVTGDVGTATSLVHMALSANQLRQQAPGDAQQTHLLLSSSDDSLRAAVVLAR